MSIKWTTSPLGPNIIGMNEHSYIKFIASEATPVCQKCTITICGSRGLIPSVVATVLVLCGIHTVLCATFKFHLVSRQILRGVHGFRHTGFGQCLRVRMPFARQLQLRCSWPLDADCDSELIANIVFRDNVEGEGENISGCCFLFSRFTSIITMRDFTRPSFHRLASSFDFTGVMTFVSFNDSVSRFRPALRSTGSPRSVFSLRLLRFVVIPVVFCVRLQSAHYRVAGVYGVGDRKNTA